MCRLTRFKEAKPCGNSPGEVEDYLIVLKKNRSLSFSLSADTLCFGEELSFNYEGDLMDSIEWNISNGATYYSSKKLKDSVSFMQAGSYIVNLTGHYKGQVFSSTFPEVIYVIDTFSYSIKQTATSLSVPEYTANYQWINYSNGSMPANSNRQSTFVPPFNGNYAVKISIAHCSSTSACIPFVSKKEFRIYPSPTSNKLWVETNLSFTEIPLQIIDSKGNLVLSQKITSNRDFIYVGGLSSGLYFVKFLNKYQKFMKL